MTVTLERQRASPAASADTTEFRAAFFQHYARVYAVLFRLVGDRAEAEDLTLETFWKLWQQPPTRSGNLAGWLYRVATRLGYNSLRATRRRMQYEAQAARENPLSPDPADEAERSDERSRVRTTLARLSERDAQILILRYSGLAYKEIAVAIGVSPNSVGTLLTRAEEEFERLYEEGGSHASQR